MSLSEKMTGLMNGVRGVAHKSNVKLSVDSATEVLNVVSAGLPFRWQEATKITSLNSLVQEGFYYGTGATITNKPANIQNSDKIKVLVLNPTDDVTQFCFVNGILWKRDNFKGDWTDWKKLGGVRNPLLSAVKGLLTPRKGGVAYVA